MIYPLPAVMVSCGATEEEYNIITVSWTGTICTNPPMCYISVQAPIIEEAPLSIECRVKEIIPLGTHEMYIAEVVNVIADDKYIDPETGKFELADSDPLVYLHGGYYHLGEKIGKFGWSVEKKDKKKKK